MKPITPENPTNSIDIVNRLKSVFFGQRQTNSESIGEITWRSDRRPELDEMKVRLEHEGIGWSPWKILDKLEVAACRELAEEEETGRLIGLCADRRRWQDNLTHARELGFKQDLGGMEAKDVEVVLEYLNTQLAGVDRKVIEVIEAHKSDPVYFLEQLH